jgi:ferredoxin
MLAMKQKHPAPSADTPSAEHLTRSPKEPEAFELNNEPDIIDQFTLEGDAVQNSASSQTLQNELYLPIENPEAPEEQPQLEFTGIEKAIYAMKVEGVEKALEFHHANTILESLEAQGVQVPYQCRDGYCGGCRTDLVEGEVAYLQEPMAWINQGEILPCCCVPKTALKLKLKG